MLSVNTRTSWTLQNRSSEMLNLLLSLCFCLGDLHEWVSGVALRCPICGGWKTTLNAVPHMPPCVRGSLCCTAVCQAKCPSASGNSHISISDLAAGVLSYRLIFFFNLGSGVWNSGLHIFVACALHTDQKPSHWLLGAQNSHNTFNLFIDNRKAIND